MEQQIPPGVLAGINKEGNVHVFKGHPKDLESWYKQYFLDGYLVPYTISVDGKEWSCQEDVITVYGTVAKIEKFSYENDEWRAEVKGGETFGKWHMRYLTKVSSPSSLDRSGSQPEYDYFNMDEQQYRELTYDERREHDTKVKASQPGKKEYSNGDMKDAFEAGRDFEVNSAHCPNFESFIKTVKK